MTEFSQEQLCRVLAAAKVKPDEQRLTALSQGLVVIEAVLRLREEEQRLERESGLLENVRDGLNSALQALDSADPSLLLSLLGGSEAWAGSVEWESRSAAISKQIEMIRCLKNNADNILHALQGSRRTRKFISEGKEISTLFWLDIRKLWHDVTGTKGTARDDGGPLYEFAKGCAALVAPELRPTKAGLKKIFHSNRVTELPPDRDIVKHLIGTRGHQRGN